MRSKLFLYSIFLLVLCSCSIQQPDLDGDRFIIRRKGADIPVLIQGSVSSDVYVIWLHGGPGASVTYDRSFCFFSELERHVRMVYTEQRGQGMAQGHFDSEALNTRESSKDVKVLAQYLKRTYGESIHLYLMGHSWGGALGTQVLLDPEAQAMFEGWIMMSGFHDSPIGNVHSVQHVLTVSQELIDEGVNTEFWQEMQDKALGYDLNDISDCVSLNEDAYEAEDTLIANGYIDQVDFYDVDRLGDIYHEDNSVTTAVADFFSSGIMSYNDSLVLDFSLHDKLDKIALPTLLLWGQYDMVVPPSMGQLYYDEISSERKYFISYENSGHGLFAQEQFEVEQDVLQFIEMIPLLD